MVLEPVLKADYPEPLLLSPGRARSSSCSHASPSYSCLQGVQCGIDSLNTSSINALSMGGLMIGGKAAIHLPFAGLCFGKLTPIVFSLAWLCSTTVRQPGQPCLQRRASSNLLKPVSSVSPQSETLRIYSYLITYGRARTGLKQGQPSDRGRKHLQGRVCLAVRAVACKGSDKPHNSNRSLEGRERACAADAGMKGEPS